MGKGDLERYCCHALRAWRMARSSLSYIDVVVSFGGGERLREVGAWVPLTIWIGLEEYGSRGKLGCIGGYGKGGIGVQKLEHGLGEEKLFQLVERLLAGGGPVPRVIFPGEV